jgi:hypothetical protein
MVRPLKDGRFSITNLRDGAGSPPGIAPFSPYGTASQLVPNSGRCARSDPARGVNIRICRLFHLVIALTETPSVTWSARSNKKLVFSNLVGSKAPSFVFDNLVGSFKASSIFLDFLGPAAES